MWKRFAIGLVLVSGCGKSPSEILKEDQQKAESRQMDSDRSLAELEAKLDREASEVRREDEQRRSEFELRKMSSAVNRTLIKDRSGYEGAVKSAIEITDLLTGIDPAVDALLVANKEWYSAYRTCESFGCSKVRGETFTDWGPKGFRRIEEQEKLAVLHAFVDFVEQYRTDGTVLSFEIRNRATKTPENPSDTYKRVYKEASEFVFAAAIAPDADQYAGQNMDAEKSEIVLARRPLFPAGSRFESDAAKDAKLFGQQ